MIDSCNKTPYQGLVAIPGISVMAWSDATGRFDLLNVPSGNVTLAFLSTPYPPLTAVHAPSIPGFTWDVGMVLYGACQQPKGPPKPPAACSSIVEQDACDARLDCRSVVAGTNCHRPDESTCQTGDESCICEPPYVFQACVARN